LIIEKLRVAVSPNSKQEERSIAELSFKDRCENGYIPIGISDPERAELTIPEFFTTTGYNFVASIINITTDPDTWSTSETESKLDHAYESLYRSLETLMKMIDGIQDSIPTFSGTLHPLYITYEYGTALMDFHKYISTPEKNVSPQQKARNAKLLEATRLLLKAIADKATAVNKAMEESGWIDRVLSYVLEIEQDQSDGAQTSSDLVVNALKSVISEDFVENWAGEVVESWRDSVGGFAHLKTPYRP